MTVHVCSPNIREIWKIFIYYSVDNITKKCRVVFPFHSLLHLHQGCCLTGAGRLKVLFKEPEWAVFIPHSHPICPMTSIFWWNRSKNHSHNKLNEHQQLLWFCFVFITRNMDQSMATKSLSANKTAENTHIWKSPYNALQAQYWINLRHVWQWIVSLLMLYWFQLQNHYLIANIFRNAGMMLLTLYLQLNKYKCV